MYANCTRVVKAANKSWNTQSCRNKFISKDNYENEQNCEWGEISETKITTLDSSEHWISELRILRKFTILDSVKWKAKKSKSSMCENGQLATNQGRGGEIGATSKLEHPIFKKMITFKKWK